MDAEVTPEEKVAEMFAWRAMQLGRLRAGLRGYGPARRDRGAAISNARRAQTLHGAPASSVSLSLDGIRFGRG